MNDNTFDELDELESLLESELQAKDLPLVHNEMEVQYEDPATLKPNPWNPNVVDPINQLKLEASIQKDGIKRPIVVRTLEDGTLEIIGGQHRTLAAMSLGYDKVPVINRGLISDAQAKKETLIDNFRYGNDDVLRFSELLQDPEIGSAEELLATMPIDEEELAGYFSHLTAENVDVEIDSILDDEEEKGETIDLGATQPTRTHQIIRFRVSVEDAAKINELVKKVRADNGYTEADDMTNDGDALVHLLLTDH
ncbi:chromosome segregation DNA-binding protein [Ectopseudomonas mendocina]|uniref:Chromosome segregation DNA-binding protein n=1 Tax=Ectopseudomonas mendocina TaxID=300 RepID=A0A379PNY4_ECTME|nr:ParB/RepB/Spo0J family partition protein [Pseudomonas mendocina]SUE95779.1 chromosome segregation DNA-binding protein [Pseudomonas mendocina]